MLQPLPARFVQPANACSLRLPCCPDTHTRQGQTEPDKGCHKIGQLRNHCFHSVYSAQAVLAPAEAAET